VAAQPALHAGPPARRNGRGGLGANVVSKGPNDAAAACAIPWHPLPPCNMQCGAHSFHAAAHTYLDGISKAGPPSIESAMPRAREAVRFSPSTWLPVAVTRPASRTGSEYTSYQKPGVDGRPAPATWQTSSSQQLHARHGWSAQQCASPAHRDLAVVVLRASKISLRPCRSAVDVPRLTPSTAAGGGRSACECEALATAANTGWVVHEDQHARCIQQSKKTAALCYSMPQECCLPHTAPLT